MKINSLKNTIFNPLLAIICLTSCVIEESIEINAPIEKVWDYISDNSKAREWSVYFHHISSLPGIEDGAVGSNRRCFRSEDESGIYWDEMVLETTLLKYREILAYNFNGFEKEVFNNALFFVHQNLSDLGNNKTMLTFSTEKIRPESVLNSLDYISAKGETEKIFKLNLTNIREAIEAGLNSREYKRKHPYLKIGEHKFD